MLGKTPKYHQVYVFQTPLKSFINMDHELIQLAEAIEWDTVEREFKDYFAELGRPGVPIRKIVGLILLKSLFNLSDESTVARWIENPYYQYFTGEFIFQTKPPIDPTDFSKFRRRIGEEGAEKLLKLSIRVNADEFSKETEVVVDTTVQEKKNLSDRCEVGPQGDKFPTGSVRKGAVAVCPCTDTETFGQE